MSTINVIRRDGEGASITAAAGQSVMQAMRDNGIDDLLALCSGSCACATCHVYVDDAWTDRLPAVSDTEDALLDNSEHRQNNSRLACQLFVIEGVDGITITVAPED